MHTIQPQSTAAAAATKKPIFRHQRYYRTIPNHPPSSPPPSARFPFGQIDNYNRWQFFVRPSSRRVCLHTVIRWLLKTRTMCVALLASDVVCACVYVCLVGFMCMCWSVCSFGLDRQTLYHMKERAHHWRPKTQPAKLRGVGEATDRPTEKRTLVGTTVIKTILAAQANWSKMAVGWA